MTGFFTSHPLRDCPCLLADDPDVSTEDCDNMLEKLKKMMPDSNEMLSLTKLRPYMLRTGRLHSLPKANNTIHQCVFHFTTKTNFLVARRGRVRHGKNLNKGIPHHVFGLIRHTDTEEDMQGNFTSFVLFLRFFSAPKRLNDDGDLDERTPKRQKTDLL